MMKLTILFVGLLSVVTCYAETITPSVYWKSQIDLPNEPFLAEEISESEPGWVKFTTLILAGYNPNTVYFQDSKEYVFHYDFATEVLDPFIGMGPAEYEQVSLYEAGQQASLGTVIVPGDDSISEYAIQFTRNDPYLKEEIRDMFNAVKASIIADPNSQAFYFPTNEQLATAETNRNWFESQGIVVSSSLRWIDGNACYSSGWALGELKYFTSSQIETAYLNGELLPSDILLTDGIPAEIPYVAGILSLSPSTPNSHVAILAKTFNVPFAHLAIAEDADNAQQLVGRTVLLCVGNDGGVCNVGLRDLEGLLTAEEIEEILALKKPPQLDISPIAYLGAYSANTDVLTPNDVNHFGGKASNFGLLRTSIPDNSPVATALSFDLWNDFLDQSIATRESVTIGPGGYKLFWADDDEEQGPTHTNFKLSKNGEQIELLGADRVTLIDTITFGAQAEDVSYGRYPDGDSHWQPFLPGPILGPTPGWSNSDGSGGPAEGLFINEFMADNDDTIQDPDGNGGYPDWIELYNAEPNTVDLGGMYLTDDPNDPTKWMIPFEITGSTLREEINNRLSAYTTYPPDMAALSADLAAIRKLFKDTNVTSFTTWQKSNIGLILSDPQYGFDENSKLRFRSSTNVEDSEQFTGAGLYSSYSGCLADDSDVDDDGPCLCDPTEPDERGVYRAIRRVFASFYNDNAFLERLRHGVNEAEVGMAVLVHHSFPDEIELANGVATLEKKEADPNMYIALVTQDGAVSVTNPIDDSIPEEVSVVYLSPSQIYPTLVRSSSLVILGEKVMDWQDDYNELSELLALAAAEFQQVTGKTNYILDLEYKKVAPGGMVLPAGGLVVKQIRQIPPPDNTPGITTPFLVNETTEYCTYQWESGNVFANHRLKSKWTLQTKNLWLTTENLEQSLYENANIEYAADGRIRNLSGTPSLWPFAAHTFDGEDTVDGWLMHHLSNRRNSGLRTDNIPTQIGSGDNPVVTLSDFGFSPGYLRLFVEYDEPVPSLNWMGPTTTTTDSIRLCPCPEPEPGDLLQQRTVTGTSGESIITSFYWPPEPNDISNYTAPLKHFVETVIEGYTTETIVLQGYYSQTFWPGHHNWNDLFIFEPQLEPGISQTILDELRAQNIKLFLMDYYRGEITTYGFDTEPFHSADIDGDDDADIADFGMFSGRWLDTICDDCSGADLTGDGQVMLDDLLEFTNNWLTEVSYP